MGGGEYNYLHFGDQKTKAQGYLVLASYRAAGQVFLKQCLSPWAVLLDSYGSTNLYLSGQIPLWEGHRFPALL
jgi:hypothetical protein